jgi:spermidine synthase
MTFPLVARLFTQSLYRVGSGVGSSYAANTVGAVLGAFAGGFILIPNLGIQNTIIFAVVMNLAIGAWVISSDTRLAARRALALAWRCWFWRSWRRSRCAAGTRIFSPAA